LDNICHTITAAAGQEIYDFLHKFAPSVQDGIVSQILAATFVDTPEWSKAFGYPDDKTEPDISRVPGGTYRTTPYTQLGYQHEIQWEPTLGSVVCPPRPVTANSEGYNTEDYTTEILHNVTGKTNLGIFDPFTWDWYGWTYTPSAFEGMSEKGETHGYPLEWRFCRFNRDSDVETCGTGGQGWDQIEQVPTNSTDCVDQRPNQPAGYVASAGCHSKWDCYHYGRVVMTEARKSLWNNVGWNNTTFKHEIGKCLEAIRDDHEAYDLSD